MVDLLESRCTASEKLARDNQDEKCRRCRDSSTTPDGTHHSSSELDAKSSVEKTDVPHSPDLAPGDLLFPTCDDVPSRDSSCVSHL